MFWSIVTLNSSQACSESVVFGECLQCLPGSSHRWNAAASWPRLAHDSSGTGFCLEGRNAKFRIDGDDKDRCDAGRKKWRRVPTPVPSALRGFLSIIYKIHTHTHIVSLHSTGIFWFIEEQQDTIYKIRIWLKIPPNRIESGWFWLSYFLDTTGDTEIYRINTISAADTELP